jgi:hypothetical protein
MKNLIPLLAIVFTTLSSAAFAQQMKGTIQGTVTDANAKNN